MQDIENAVILNDIKQLKIAYTKYKDNKYNFINNITTLIKDHKTKTIFSYIFKNYIFSQHYLDNVLMYATINSDKCIVIYLISIGSKIHNNTLDAAIMRDSADKLDVLEYLLLKRF